MSSRLTDEQIFDALVLLVRAVARLRGENAILWQALEELRVSHKELDVVYERMLHVQREHEQGIFELFEKISPDLGACADDRSQDDVVS